VKGVASACGSVTVVNAIALGKGAAFSIDLGVEAEVELEDGSGEIEGLVGDSSEDPTLVEMCVEKVLDHFDVSGDYDGRVETTTDLPIAVGLSSSSAAANATVLATAGALGEELSDEEVLDIGIEAAFDAGTTITGAFDDASASYFGGGTVTDNEEMELLNRFDVDPELHVLIFVPEGQSYTVDVDQERAEAISKQVELAHYEALSRNWQGAQTLNGLLYCSVFGYDAGPSLDALDCGALSAGLTGTGPAHVAVCEEEKVEDIKDCWKDYDGMILETKPSVKGAVLEDE